MPTRSDPEGVAELIVATRKAAALYGFLAHAFGPITTAWRARLAADAARLAQGLAGGEADSDWPAIPPLLTDISRHARGTSLEQARRESVILFGHGGSGSCPPYETEYMPRSDVIPQNVMADIAGFYLAFGLEPAPGTRERLDHLSIECEFMHAVAVKEIHASLRGQAESASVCREARKHFIEGHPGRWLPHFARGVDRRAEGTLFGALAQLADAAVRADGAVLDARIVPLGPVPATPPPADDDICMSCSVPSGAPGAKPGPRTG